MSAFCVSESELAAFLAGDQAVRASLPVKLNRALLNQSRRRAPDLAPDIIEEVVQETWLELLTCSPGSFDPSRGTASAFLSLKLGNAITRVRASYTPPGQRTRAQRNDRGDWLSQTSAVSFDETLAEDAGEELTLHDIVACHRAAGSYANVIDCAESDWLLRKASASAEQEIVMALQLIATGDHDLTSTACLVGLHRSTLRRRIDRWVDRQQLRAA